MKLDDVRTFVAVAGEGSIQGAAAALGITQPAVTRQIQRLERALDADLLDRRTKPPTLSEAGTRILPACRRLLKSAADVAALSRDAAAPTGELHLAVAHGIEDIALGAPLDELRARFPKLTVRISTGSSLPLLDQASSGRFDVVVVLLPYGRTPPEAFNAHLLGRDPLTVVAPESWAVEPGPPGRGVGEAGWVLNAEGCGHRATLERALGALDAPFTVNAEAFDVGVQLSLVARGAGLGLASRRALAASPERHRLKPVTLEGADLAVGVWLLADRAGESLRAAIECFETALSAALHAAPESSARKQRRLKRGV